MGIDRVNKEDFFERNEGRGRGHFMKLYKKIVHLDIAKYSFGNRVCVTSGTNFQLQLYHPKA